MLVLIDPSSECINQLVVIALMNKDCESKRLLPKQVDHFFQVIDAFFTEEHVLGEWIGLVAAFALEVLADPRSGELRFAHRSRKAERKYWVDETMRVTDADESFAAEAPHLIRVVWDDMHLLDELDLGYSAGKVGVNFGKIIAKEILRRLPRLLERGRRHY